MNLAEQMSDLYSRFGKQPGITIELHKSLIAIGVRNQAASATVFLQGAQLTHYQRTQERPLIWLSPECDYRPGASLRGGIPVCWPWFGDLNRNPREVREQVAIENSPAHGFVRSRDWQLDSIRQPTPSLTELTLSLDIAATSEPLWPFASRLTLQISIGSKLTLDLSICNNDSSAFTFTSALHTYFAVATIDQSQVIGLEGCTYIDALDDWQRKQQNGAIRIDQEVDRIYLNVPKRMAISDPGNQRQISLSTHNSSDAVVWNPWIDKAQRLSCFAPAAYRDMLCVETGNIADNAITLSAGATHCSQLQIT